MLAGRPGTTATDLSKTSVVLRHGEVPGHVVDAGALTGGAAELVGAAGALGEGDDAGALRQPVFLVHVVERRDELAARQVARSPEDYNRGALPATYGPRPSAGARGRRTGDRKSTRLNSSHANISYAVFCLKKKKTLAYPVWAGFQFRRRSPLSHSSFLYHSDLQCLLMSAKSPTTPNQMTITRENYSHATNT